MSIVYLPANRIASAAEHAALRAGPGVGRFGTVVQLVQRQAYCATCAAPIDFGVLWKGGEAFCSVDCSLGGDRPA